MQNKAKALYLLVVPCLLVVRCVSLGLQGLYGTPRGHKSARRLFCSSSLPAQDPRQVPPTPPHAHRQLILPLFPPSLGTASQPGRDVPRRVHTTQVRPPPPPYMPVSDAMLSFLSEEQFSATAAGAVVALVAIVVLMLVQVRG